MKVIVDDFVSPALLGDATSQKPVIAEIESVHMILADDLPFESKKDRFELLLLLDGEQKSWLPNKTTLRSLIASYGQEGEKWVGRKIKLWPVDQSVSGKMKKVVYGDAVL